MSNKLIDLMNMLTMSELSVGAKKVMLISLHELYIAEPDKQSKIEVVYEGLCSATHK